MRGIEKRKVHVFVFIGLFLGFLLFIGGTMSSATASPPCVTKNIKVADNQPEIIKNSRGIPGEDVKFGVYRLYTLDGVTFVYFTISEYDHPLGDWFITEYIIRRSDDYYWSSPRLEVGTDQELYSMPWASYTTIPKKIDVAHGRIRMEICKV